MRGFLIGNFIYKTGSVKSQARPGLGFALPMALMLGLLAVLIAMTTIARSQANQTSSITQKKKLQVSWVVDAGVSQILAKLKDGRYQTLLGLNYDPVDPNSNPSNQSYLGPNGIPKSGDEAGAATDQWNNAALKSINPCTGNIDVNNDFKLVNNLGTTTDPIGQYRLLAYRFSASTGYVLIEGTQPTGGVSRRWVTLPLKQVSNIGKVPFPGVFASQTINLQKLSVLKVSGDTGKNANIVCTDCGFNPNGMTSGNPNCPNNFPTTEAQEAAVNLDGSSGGSSLDGQVAIIPTAQLQPIPPWPTTSCTSTSGYNCSFNLGSNLTSTSLPRPADIPKAATWPSGKPMIYRVAKVNLNGVAVTIKTSANRPVYLYITNPGGSPQGQLFLINGAKISNIDNINPSLPGSPENFRIFGNAADPINANIDQEFDLEGTPAPGSYTISNAIIDAPDALVKIKDSASILGAVWAKAIDGTNSNGASINVPDAIPDTLNPLSTSALQSWGIRPFTSWNQVPVE